MVAPQNPSDPSATDFFPPLFKVEQTFDQPAISSDHIPSEIHAQLDHLHLSTVVKSGETIAITAGSRGIRHMATMLKSLVDEFKALGAKPFIFPAMGSHGGGTAEGQTQVLANYGITEASMGCEIRATMTVKMIGETVLGTPVFLDRYAAEADHIFVINRVKPHTKFVGTVESGLLKMCLIGMGKREGARTYHRAVAHHSWDAIAFAVLDVILAQSPILGGLAIIQNAHEDIAELHGLRPSEFASKEPELLLRASALMGRLPFPEIDLLVVDEMGKEFSGTGMDTNVTGRKEGSSIHVHRLYARALSAQTHGNAQGIGLADFTQQSLVDQINYSMTYLNSQTAYRTDTCKIPMTLANDLEVLRIATQMAGIGPNAHEDQFRVVWIRNTLELDEFYVSEAFLPQVDANPSLQILAGPYRVEFTEKGESIIRSSSS